MVIYTLSQMPMLRPRMVGIQSQPIEAWNVGLSAPKMPPFWSGLCAFCSLTAPKFLFLIMRMAKIFVVPGMVSFVILNFDGLKGPLIKPIRLPFKKITAFQLMPSKCKNNSCLLKSSGKKKVVRYQKSE